MTHLKRKLMMTLALLITAATGAWATDYTTLAVGDVIKVGDKFTPTAESEGAFNEFGVDNGVTYTLMRADVDNGYNVTEKTDGAYYVFKFVTDKDPYIHFEKAFAVTAISDGLEVTKIETDKGKQLYTLAVHEPAGTPFAITWSAATPNTASIDKMPAGNVTVNVDYFPQAELAESGAPTAIADVPATTDGPIVTPGTVANIGTSEVKQGTLMYYVSTTEMTNAQLQALTPDQWSEDVPTAANLLEGAAYVYYYIQGAEPATIAARTDDNTRSDGDILAANVVNVTLAAAPLWNAEFDLTNAPEEDKAPGVWSTDIPEDGVVKGTPVKVTYTGSKKIIGVKAAKKAEAKPLANATTEDLGKVVGADGNIYDTKADAEAVATGNAVAMICYVNEGHGLALALSDISSHYHSWDNSGSYNEGKTAAELCSAWNTSKAVTGATWKLASKLEMTLMINAAGNYAALRDGFSAVGGTNMIDEYYWLSDESSADYAENINFSYNDGWNQEFKYENQKVRACLAF